MPRRTTRPGLTPEQQAEAKRIHAALVAATAADLRLPAEQLASTSDRTIFGANEFTVRDIVLGIGAKAIETALEVRPQSRTAVLADTTGSEEAYRGRRFAAGCLPLAGDGTGLLPTLVPPSGARGAVQ